MGLWNRLGGWFTRSAAANAACAHHLRTNTDEELPTPPERPWGCGWFDSSLDLREGLAVFEHDGIDLGLAVRQMLAASDVCH